MNVNTNEKPESVIKTGDTLLVLHHETGIVGIVQRLGENGEVSRMNPETLNSERMLS